MRGITAIESDWLDDIPGGLFKRKEAIPSTKSGDEGKMDKNTDKDKRGKLKGGGGGHANLVASRGASRPMQSAGNYVSRKKQRK